MPKRARCERTYSPFVGCIRHAVHRLTHRSPVWRRRDQLSVPLFRKDDTGTTVFALSSLKVTGEGNPCLEHQHTIWIGGESSNLADADRDSIALIPSFYGLRCFMRG
ncbi:hypothetical protein KCP70_00570 [Salmonella enterica subsp. enterica]|nr:hypothetical protein KCP70_00570 [Salmonella enterica subsp. enterica]